MERAVEDARLKEPIAATVRLARAARVHELLAHGKVLGRIVLRIARASTR